MSFKKLFTTKSFSIFSQTLFWLSHVAIITITTLFTLAASGIETSIFSGMFSNANLSEWNLLFAYTPSFSVVLILISAIYLTKKKESPALFKLFFAVELPILLVCFGQNFFNVYPITIFYLSLVILLASLWLWFELLFPQKIKLLTKYNYIPLVIGTVLSGWLFLIWFFWVPLFVWFIMQNFWEIITDFFPIIFKKWFILPSAITLIYLFLSPGLAFGMFTYQTYKKAFPRKPIIILSTILVLVGGTFLFDLVEKHGSYVEFKHIAAALNISQDTEQVPFSQEDLKKISNLNRLKESTKKVYLAGLKYPFKKKQEINAIHQAVYSGYCDSPLEIHLETEIGKICYAIAEIYEQLFFPLFYEGDFAQDRRLAQKVYTYVFDKSLQKELAQEINTLKKRSLLGTARWNNSWRNIEAGVIHEFQTAVHLDEANYEIDYHQSLGVYTNLVTFTLQNTRATPQEVFLEFNLPDTESVITDLKLGLNLELASQVAPRGAAKQVYEESVSRGIDPALLAQVGPRQYQLRVFPIPSVQNTITQGKQKVQFEYTAFTKNDILQVIPPLKTRNLKISSKTDVRYILKNEQNETLEHKSIESSDFKQGLVLTKKDPASKAALKISDNTYANVQSLANVVEKDFVFFIDNSASVETEKMQTVFKELKSAFPENPFYTFNFTVQPAPKNREDLKFWGPTDTQALVAYLTKQELANKNIVIITDESDFEIKEQESLQIKYSDVPKPSNYSVLVLGEHLPAFKQELTKLLLAGTNSAVILLAQKSNLTDLWQTKEQISWNISNEDALDQYEVITTPKWREALEDLWAYKQSKEALSTISNEQTWLAAANSQTAIAAKAHIVNQFNSLIALENEWQKRRLKEEISKKDKYQADHDTGEVPDETIFNTTFENQAAPEPQVYTVIIFFLFTTFLLLVNRKKLL